MYLSFVKSLTQFTHTYLIKTINLTKKKKTNNIFLAVCALRCTRQLVCSVTLLCNIVTFWFVVAYGVDTVVLYCWNSVYNVVIVVTESGLTHKYNFDKNHKVKFQENVGPAELIKQLDRSLQGLFSEIVAHFQSKNHE